MANRQRLGSSTSGSSAKQLLAFHDLQAKGLDAFLAQNDGEGWMLPETLRLADYGLGHDARAPQPVAPRLGPRFHPWQLEGMVEESWAESRRHAENLRRIRAVGGAVAPPTHASNTFTESPGAAPAASADVREKDLLGYVVSQTVRIRKRR